MLEKEPRWPMFNRVWRREALADLMIQHIGIDLVVAMRIDHGKAYREACRNCLTCQSTETCREWISNSDEPAQLQDFCPNNNFFKRCISQQWHCANSMESLNRLKRLRSG